MFERCPSTVFGDTTSTAAASFVERPPTTSLATRRSVSVRPSELRRPLILASSRRALAAQRAAPSSSKIAIAASIDCRARLSLEPTQYLALREQRPRQVEAAVLHTLVLGDRALERLQGTRFVASGRR